RKAPATTAAFASAAQAAGHRRRHFVSWSSSAFLPRIAEILLPPELAAQFGFGLLKRAAARGGEVPAGAIDVEDQHRQRGARGIRLAPTTLFGRMFERSGDALGIAPRKDAAVE